MPITLKNKILKETSISIFVNMFISITILWISLPEEEMLPLIGGPESAGFGLFPFTILFLGIFIPVMTIAVRKQIVSGSIVLDKNTSSCFLPENIFIKTLLLLCLFLFIIAPIYLYLVNMILGLEISYINSWIINLVYVVLLSSSAVPLVIKCAIKK